MVYDGMGSIYAYRERGYLPLQSWKWKMGAWKMNQLPLPMTPRPSFFEQKYVIQLRHRND